MAFRDTNPNLVAMGGALVTYFVIGDSFLPTIFILLMAAGGGLVTLHAFKAYAKK